MPDQTITNQSSAYGETGKIGQRAIPMVNQSTATINAFSVVGLTTTSAASPGNTGFVTPVGVAAINVIGVLQTDTVVGASGMVVTEGPSLIAISSSAVPAVGDLLAFSTISVSTASGSPTVAVVKTSTAGTPIGSIIGYCLSTAVDSTVLSSTNIANFVPAYIHKM